MLITQFSTANFFGFLSLVCYIITLLPTNLRIVFPQTRKTEINRFLFKQRRLIGILAFILAIFHAWILVNKRDFDFWDIKTYWVYIQGVSCFIIFTLLGITSNDWSVKRLKKNWKRLHNLTYLAMFLLTWHIWDKMAEHWSNLTPASLVGILAIIVLFLKRRFVEHEEQKQKTAFKKSCSGNNLTSL